MKLVLETTASQQFVIDVEPDEQIQNIKTIAEEKTQIPRNQIQLMWNNAELPDTARLSNTGIKEGSVVQVKRREAVDLVSLLASNISAGLRRGQPPQPQPQPQIPQRPRVQIPDPEVYRQSVLATPNLLHQLLHSDSQLAEAILSEDITLLRALLTERALIKQREQEKLEEEARRLNENPFDPQAQAMIEEKIRQENVIENMEHAIEYHPESFGRIVMLYVNAEVNGNPIKAFVDSGAQQTIMSEDCAKRCNIMRLIDRRWAGIATGVGTAKILGRVHSAPIKIGNAFFPCAFTILEGSSLEFLLGLDMLRRHQAILDLKSNVLRIQDEVVPFLAEGDIPENLRSTKLTDDQVAELESRLKTSGGPSNSPSAPNSTSSSATPSTTQTPTVPPEAAISTLMNLGYGRAEVLEALTVCNGNVDAAAAYLLERH